jgi:hypothetical protein
MDRAQSQCGPLISSTLQEICMRKSIPLLVAGLILTVLPPVLAQSRATADANIQRYSGEPALPAAAEKMTEQGFADHSRVNAAKAGKHAITFVEEGPNDTGVSLTMDPVSGEIAPAKQH